MTAEIVTALGNIAHAIYCVGDVLCIILVVLLFKKMG